MNYKILINLFQIKFQKKVRKILGIQPLYNILNQNDRYKCSKDDWRPRNCCKCWSNSNTSWPNARVSSTVSIVFKINKSVIFWKKNSKVEIEILMANTMRHTMRHQVRTRSVDGTVEKIFFSNQKKNQSRLVFRMILWFHWLCPFRVPIGQFLKTNYRAHQNRHRKRKRFEKMIDKQHENPW